MPPGRFWSFASSYLQIPSLDLSNGMSDQLDQHRSTNLSLCGRTNNNLDLTCERYFYLHQASSRTDKTVACYSPTTSSTSWLISKLEMASDYTTKTRISRNEKKKQSTRWIDFFVIWLERNSHDDVTKIDGNHQTNSNALYYIPTQYQKAFPCSKVKTSSSRPHALCESNISISIY